MNILGLIPARSGSKGIPGKNMKLLKGKPIIWYTIEAALASKYIHRTVVSTDSEEIANIAREAKAEIPFIRPANLAQDDTPMNEVLIHAIQEMERINWPPDVLVLLQPTSPFRTTNHLDIAIEKFLESSASCLISVRKVRDNPYWIKTLDEGYLCPFLENEKSFHTRQSLPLFYYPNGAIYIWKTNTLLNSTQQLPVETIPYEMDVYSSLDLDEEIDWLFAEFLLLKEAKENR